MNLIKSKTDAHADDYDLFEFDNYEENSESYLALWGDEIRGKSLVKRTNKRKNRKRER